MAVDSTAKLTIFNGRTSDSTRTKICASEAKCGKYTFSENGITEIYKVRNHTKPQLLIVLTLANGKQLRLTYTHLLYRITLDGLQLIRAEQLSVGDQLRTWDDSGISIEAIESCSGHVSDIYTSDSKLSIHGVILSCYDYDERRAQIANLGRRLLNALSSRLANLAA